MVDKQNFGQFNTVNAVWLKPQVRQFIIDSGFSTAVDPFAGKGDLLKVARELGFKTKGYDIDPSLGWKINDSLLNIPKHKDAIIITNPPYLAKVSASRQSKSNGKYFDLNGYADLYQLAIEKVLNKYTHAVFIIPETFVLSGLFKNYIYSITTLEENPFADTECPVCVVCFKSDTFVNTFDIYKNSSFLFNNVQFDDILNTYRCQDILNIKFNDGLGNIGLRAIDGVSEGDHIRFCLPGDLGYDISGIKHSSRSITVMNVCSADNVTIDIDALIKQANNLLEVFRKDTQDMILAPFKNNNKLGQRRRRLDFYWARRILNKAYLKLI